MASSRYGAGPQRPLAEFLEARILRRRRRPSGLYGKPLARASARLASSSARPDRRRAAPGSPSRSARRSARRAAACHDQGRGDADRAAGVEDMDHRPGIGRRDAQGRMRLAGRRAADQQRQSCMPSRCISPATVTISSSDGVIRPDRPIMSALVVRGGQDVCDGTTPRSRTSAVARQDDADDVLADVVDVALDGGHDGGPCPWRPRPSPPR